MPAQMPDSELATMFVGVGLHPRREALEENTKAMVFFRPVVYTYMQHP